MEEETGVIRNPNVMVKRFVLLALVALSIITTRAVIAAVSAPAMSAGDALKLLLEGNQRFIDGKLEHPNQTVARRVEVAKGQHPFAAMLACSDSRTPPEIIFDRGLGDIFVVRVAGHGGGPVGVDKPGHSGQQSGG